MNSLNASLQDIRHQHPSICELCVCSVASNSWDDAPGRQGRHRHVLHGLDASRPGRHHPPHLCPHPSSGQPSGRGFGHLVNCTLALARAKAYEGHQTCRKVNSTKYVMNFAMKGDCYNIKSFLTHLVSSEE